MLTEGPGRAHEFLGCSDLDVWPSQSNQSFLNPSLCCWEGGLLSQPWLCVPLFQSFYWLFDKCEGILVICRWLTSCLWGHPVTSSAYPTNYTNQFSGLILFFLIFYCPDCFSRTCLQVFCWPFICFTALKLVDVAPVGPCWELALPVLV